MGANTTGYYCLAIECRFVPGYDYIAQKLRRSPLVSMWALFSVRDNTRYLGSFLVKTQNITLKKHMHLESVYLESAYELIYSAMTMTLVSLLNSLTSFLMLG